MPLADWSPAGKKSGSRLTGSVAGGQQMATMLGDLAEAYTIPQE